MEAPVYECVQKWSPRGAALEIVETCNHIIDDYRAQGFTLTLRQLYYQLVSRDIIPNQQAEYDKLSDIVSRARRGGFMDWTAIEDRTRNLQSNTHWLNPAQIMHAAASSYQVDHWEGQKYRPEVWIEKDALSGVIEPICRELDVSYFSCRGYTSDSELWRAAKRVLKRNKEHAQSTVILHFGDHDPSGVDMSRDIAERLALLMGGGVGSSYPGVCRIALNMDQIQQYDPPPNPAKLSDARAEKYIREYGTDSWELDALDPKTIIDLIRVNVAELRDTATYDAVIKAQAADRQRLTTAARKFK